jgi:dipeptidase
VATHNNDCQECDYRIARVPARDWPKGTLRPVHDTRNYYPRFLEEPGSKLDIHGPDYYPDATDFSQWNWTYTQPIGYIDQVPHTYAYILGSYGIQNEKQLSFGESTCKGRFFAKPVFAPGGRALLNIYTLSELGMERCDSARCAIQTMGDLATKFGFYGNGYDEDEESALEEAGEALVITDPNETW